MGLFSALFGGQINPVAAPSAVGSGAQGNFFNALFGGGMQGGSLAGLPSYQGQLSPNVGQTMLPNVWGSWQQGGGAGQNYLQSMLQNPSKAYFDTTPMWTSMVASQQNNIKSGLANLNEQFNNSGNFGGTGMGIANAKFLSQTAADQNALLGQLMQGSFNTGQQNLMNAANQYTQNGIQNLLAGSQLGQQQYNIGQNQINNQYQEWMSTQPAYNPLLPYMFQGATTYAPMYTPSYSQGLLGQMIGSAGSIMGGLGAMGLRF